MSPIPALQKLSNTSVEASMPVWEIKQSDSSHVTVSLHFQQTYSRVILFSQLLALLSQLLTETWILTQKSSSLFGKLPTHCPPLCLSVQACFFCCAFSSSFTQCCRFFMYSKNTPRHKSNSSYLLSWILTLGGSYHCWSIDIFIGWSVGSGFNRIDMLVYVHWKEAENTRRMTGRWTRGFPPLINGDYAIQTDAG